MKSPTPHILAALLAAAAVQLAHAQSADARPAVPAADAPQGPANLVAGPTASVSKPDDTANKVAEALNADASLRNAKVTVQADGSNILLTGSAITLAQKMRASEVATAHAGGGTVINAMVPDEFVHWVAPTGEEALAEAEPSANATVTKAAQEMGASQAGST